MNKPVRKDPLPSLENLYHRHPGITLSLCKAYSEAASVSLSRHHSPPIDLTVLNSHQESIREIEWNAPNDTQERSWNNVDDATRDGAYSISLATVEAEFGLVAIERAETRTGADYYLSPVEQSNDLEGAYRLEVSGIDRGSKAEVDRRLRLKVDQLKRGNSNLPALASVVGFLLKIVSFEHVNE